MTTVQFMSAKYPVSFSVDDEVAARLLTQASESMKSGNAKNASAYANRLLKWALDNYKDEVPVPSKEAEAILGK